MASGRPRQMLEPTGGGTRDVPYALGAELKPEMNTKGGR